MNLNQIKVIKNFNKHSKHLKCKGYMTPDYGWGSDFECGYETSIDCDDCKYGRGKKDPNSKKNK